MAKKEQVGGAKPGPKTSGTKKSGGSKPAQKSGKGKAS